MEHFPVTLTNSVIAKLDPRVTARCRVGKGALLRAVPTTGLRPFLVGTLRFAHPTTPPYDKMKECCSTVIHFSQPGT